MHLYCFDFIMAEPLKLVYSEAFIDKVIRSWSTVLPQLDANSVKDSIFSNGWEALELKERSSRISDVMGQVFPKDFKRAIPLLYDLMEAMDKVASSKRGYAYYYIPEYVEKFGRQHIDLALPLLERITQFISCEFAIRPFILDDEKKTMQQMLKWSKSSNTDVRRLSSEGCRSRLPWAMALPRFKKDASLILPILENLKADSSLYVRKSVANNLNDISKDHPQLALQIAQKWIGKHKNIDWVVKHAMRTLLKAGEPKAMELFGYANIKHIAFSNFKVHSKKVQFGEQLQFSFSIQNQSKKDVLVRLEYAIHFMKRNGKQAAKVFKISERPLAAQQQLDVVKKHAIKAISTRKYYPGEHFVSVIINGIAFEKQSFLLNM